jgi:outer membrane receptor for ferrienterochelin and colicins
MIRHPHSVAMSLCLAAALVGPALAQTSPPPPAPQSTAPADPPLEGKPAPSSQRVEITGGRGDDTEQRRQSTAAKIVIGRDEIERFGDTSTQDLLKRLPGISTQGPPGRGRGVRMRGLGGSYTQILIDGERVPPGFSIDSIAPDQIERIEILRAPTAETGARAIAGSINFVMREGFRKRLNDLRAGLSVEHGRVSPGLSWTRNDTAGPFIYNFSLSLFKRNRSDESETLTISENLAAGTPPVERHETLLSIEHRQGLHATGRLQWRGGDGESVLLNPLLIHAEGRTDRHGRVDDGRFEGHTDSRFDLFRLNGQWNRRLGDGTRLEAKAGASESRWRGVTERREFDAAQTLVASTDDRTATADRNANATLKLSKLLANDHSLVGGAELETNRRSESRETVQNGQPILLDFGDNLKASSRRLALYAQDEWNPSPQWSAHAGLRWEGILVQGDSGNGLIERNRSSVLTPLLHAVWKPDPKSRDQLRMSLTRSYRSPSLGNLVGRPVVNSQAPAPGPNSPTRADRAGNPELRPELATGIDLAFERYLSGGGLLSANLFRRQISDLIRSQTALEAVSWANVPRWVSRPQNIGDATVQGIELEAKFRVSDLWADAPPVDVRSNLSLFRSRVHSVPGPDNRLDQQPGATANLGADYRLRGLPVTIGGNLNWTPGYDSRLSETQTAFQGRKLVADAYALWVVNPALQVRLTASNLAAADLLTRRGLDDGSLRESAQTSERTDVNWQLRLEMKL